MIDYEIESELKPLLPHDERLIWTGRPKTGIRLKAADAFLIPFSLFWCGFVAFWEFSAFQMGAPIFFNLFGLPFVAVGLYLLVGRFFVDAKSRMNTVYGISSKNIIIKSGAFRKSTHIIRIDSITDFNLFEKPDGSGSIAIGTNVTPIQANQVSNRMGTAPLSLELIDDVKTVYAKIIELKNKNG